MSRQTIHRLDTVSRRLAHGTVADRPGTGKDGGRAKEGGKEAGPKTGLYKRYCCCVVGLESNGFFGIQNSGACARVSFGT